MLLYNTVVDVFLKLAERLVAKAAYWWGKCCVGDIILRLKRKRKGSIIILYNNVLSQLKTKVIFHLTQFFA